VRGGGSRVVVVAALWSFVKNGNVSSLNGSRVARYVCTAETSARQAMAVSVL